MKTLLQTWYQLFTMLMDRGMTLKEAVNWAKKFDGATEIEKAYEEFNKENK